MIVGLRRGMIDRRCSAEGRRRSWGVASELPAGQQRERFPAALIGVPVLEPMEFPSLVVAFDAEGSVVVPRPVEVPERIDPSRESDPRAPFGRPSGLVVLTSSHWPDRVFRVSR